MINLLHPEIKENRATNRRFNQLCGFFIILALLAISTWLSLLYAHDKIIQKGQELDERISTVTTKILKFRELEKNIILTNNRLDQVSALESNRQKWSNHIIALANNTPANIQINSLTIGQSTDTTQKDYQFTIAATAKTLDDIETYRKTLDASGTFVEATFKTATFNPETSGFSFNISTKLKTNP